MNMASPASPKDYLEHPIETLDVGRRDAEHAGTGAATQDARFLLTSTSECYGDPQVHPQVETLLGQRESGRTALLLRRKQALRRGATMAYHRKHGVRTNIARIFNTYGPRMKLDDGRVVPAFSTRPCAASR